MMYLANSRERYVQRYSVKHGAHSKLSLKILCSLRMNSWYWAITTVDWLPIDREEHLLDQYPLIPSDAQMSALVIHLIILPLII